MDLRPLYWSLTLVALGAGIATAWFETRKDPSEDSPPERAPSPWIADPWRAESFSPARTQAPAELIPRDSRSEERDGGPSHRTVGGTRDGGEAAIDPRPLVEEAAPEELEALERVKVLLERGSLDDGGRIAKKIAEESLSRARFDARRLAARAELLSRLLDATRAEELNREPDRELDRPRTELRDGSPDATRYEVLLANGVHILARDVEERPSEYIVRIDAGDRRSLPREDVVEVREAPAAPQASAAGENAHPARDAPAVRSANDGNAGPVERFYRDVSVPYRAGETKRAYQVFTEILERAEGENLVREIAKISGAGKEDSLFDLWRDAIAKEDPGEAAVDLLPPPRTRAEGVARARRLFDEARAGYRAAFGKEGREKELVAAYEKLRKAQDNLALIPESAVDEEVRELRRRVVQFLFDIERALPFDS